MRILIFGDSIAYGEYDSRGGWANRLYLEYLNRQANDLEGDHPFIFNLSVGGETTRGVIKRLPPETEGRRWPGEEFTFVFAIGINDSRRLSETGQAVSSPEAYAKDLQTLVALARTYSQKILFIGLTPVDDDIFRDDKYSNARIWEFEQVLRQFVQDNNLPFVPLFEGFKTRLEAGEKLLLDGLHPNDAGHDYMIEKIRTALKRTL